jgi:hypothetical protein
MTRLLLTDSVDTLEEANEKATAFTVAPIGTNSDLAKSEDGNKYDFILQDAPNLYKYIGASMSKRFIKFIPSEKSSWLRKNFPNAFIVLSLIAERARRTTNDYDGLQIGDAIIGRREASEECGLTINKFRKAIDQLIEFGMIEIVVNTQISKKVKKRTTRIPTRSRVVNMLKSDIWDINPETDHQINHQIVTRSSPDRHHKQELKNEERIEEYSFPKPLSCSKEYIDPKIAKIEMPRETKILLSKYPKHAIEKAIEDCIQYVDWGNPIKDIGNLMLERIRSYAEKELKTPDDHQIITT